MICVWKDNELWSWKQRDKCRYRLSVSVGSLGDKNVTRSDFRRRHTLINSRWNKRHNGYGVHC